MGVKASTLAKIYRLTTGTRATWSTTTTSGLKVGPAPSNLGELTLVRGDIGCTHETSEAELDLKGRDETMYEPTIRKLGFEFQHVYDQADTHFQALQAAWLARSVVALAILDDDKATVGAAGYWADFKVFKFQKSEDLGDVQMVTIAVKPCVSSVNPEIVKVSA
jgi:hypothetical protein